MKTYIQNITEALLIMEMPQHDLNITKQQFGKITADVPELIMSRYHKTATHLGSERYHCKVENGGHVYYHVKDNKPKEFSIIDSNNTQTLAGANNGESSHNHIFMNYHIDKYGELRSSNKQSTGGKHLWTTFMKSNSDKKFSLNDPDSKKSTPIDHNTSPDKIWSNNPADKTYIKVEK